MTGYQKYVRTDIQTSDPRAVIVILYEGAMNFLKQWVESVRGDRRSEMSYFINRTQKIIQYLSSSLDFENGGEVAVNLDRLYAYMRDTLNEANIGCQPEKIEEVIGLFRTLLEGWREIVNDPEAAAALERRGNRSPDTGSSAADSGGAAGVCPPQVEEEIRKSASGGQPASEDGTEAAYSEAGTAYPAAARSAYGLRTSA